MNHDGYLYRSRWNMLPECRLGVLSAISANAVIHEFMLACPPLPALLFLTLNYWIYWMKLNDTFILLSNLAANVSFVEARSWILREKHVQKRRLKPPCDEAASKIVTIAIFCTSGL